MLLSQKNVHFYVFHLVLNVCTSICMCHIVQDEECDKQPVQSEEVDEMISWMKENREPEEDTKRYMGRTADYRKHFVQQERHTLADILQEFPRILDPGMVRTC